jgi:hypothetical protein
MMENLCISPVIMKGEIPVFKNAVIDGRGPEKP